MRSIPYALSLAGFVAACASRENGASPQAPDTGAGAIDAGSSVDAGSGEVECLLCEDFEATTIDATKWEEERARGTATLDTSRAFRGRSSLHVQLEAGGRAYLRARARVPLAGQRLFGRVHMYVPASAAPTLESHSNVFALAGKNAIGATSVHAVAIGASAFFGLYFQDDPMIDESSFVRNPGAPLTKVPLDRWFCLEWELDAVEERFALVLDGKPIPSSVIEGRAAALEAEVLLGAEFDLAEAWLDDFALARSRIGCLE